MVKKKANEIIYLHFTVFDSDGVSPLTGQAGSCTSSLRKNGAATAESVTIAEIGSTGRYYASFTPLAVADYDLEITCPDDRVIGESYETETNDLDDLADDIATVDSNVDTINTNVIKLIGIQGEWLAVEWTFSNQDNTSIECWQYDSEANWTTHDKSTGLLNHWTMSTTFSSGIPTVAKIKREDS